MIGAIAGHYRILDKLGRGGMGEVYLAEDTRLRRPVALKLLGPEARCSDDARDRLVREARVASALNHPGIAVIYEVGEADVSGDVRAFIAMEFVPGRSLKQRLDEGALSAEQALDISQQLAEALTEAHAKGVVHRDIKPANVMITDRQRAKILDFGVAAYVPVVDETSDTWSQDRGVLPPGAVLGTVAYMSPEQARGRAVDGRSDVFSLGVVIYEMLAGRAPFRGEGSVEILEAVLRDEPDAILELAPGPPEALERIARRMMAKSAKERYPTMAEVLAVLSELREGGLGPPPPVMAPPSVAVIRFRNVTGRSEDDWLGTGIAETVAADLKKIPGITVISRERVHEVRRKIGADDRDEQSFAPRLGREVGSRWVVCGAHQRLGEAVRVTARVIEVASGQVAHTVKLDGTMGEIFDLQDRIVDEISRGLRLSLKPDARDGEETRVVEAYEAFSKGVINLRAQTPESLDRAIMFFERAIALDAGYASAHLRLGTAFDLKGAYLSAPELSERAMRSIERAIELRPDFGEAWRELASATHEAGRDAAAMQAATRAAELDPFNGATHATVARIRFIGMADFEAAADGYERAFELNPQGGWYALQLAHCAALLRQFARGEEAARRALVLQEEFLSGRQGLLVVGSYVRMGHLLALRDRHEEAIDAFAREADFLGRVDHALRERMTIEIGYRKGSSQIRAGQTAAGRENVEAALAAFEKRLGMGTDDPFTRYYAACARTVLGDLDGALEDLERAARKRAAYTIRRALSEPDLEPLREHTRFGDVAKLAETVASV